MGLNRLTALNSLSKSLKKSGKLFKKVKLEHVKWFLPICISFLFLFNVVLFPSPQLAVLHGDTTIGQRSSINV